MEKVTLKEILEARKNRQAEQHRLINEYGFPVISLTVLAAGNIKRTEESLYIADEAVKLIEGIFGDKIVCSVKRDVKTGYEAMFSVDCGEMEIKKKTCEAEMSHPLGRYMDIDVISLKKIPVSREQAGYEARKCLICGRPARECMRSKVHTAEEINEIIKEAVKKFRGEKSDK